MDTITFIIWGCVFASFAIGIAAVLLYWRLTLKYRKLTQVIRNEKRFRVLIEHCAEIISLIDKNGRVIYVSPDIEKITGFTADEIVGSDALALLYPEYAGITKTFLDELLKSPGVSFPRTNRFTHKNGGEVWVEGVVINLLDEESVKAIVCNYHEITERKNAEKSEGEIQERLKAIFNGTSDAILLADNSGKYVQANPAAVKMLGYTEEELLHKTITQLVSGNDISNLWSEFIEQGHQKGTIELIRKDGETIICHYTATANILSGLHLTILRDITETTRAIDAVRDTENKYHYLFDNNPMPMWVFDRDDLHFLDVNEAALSHYGYSRREFLSMSSLDIRPKDEVERYKAFLEKGSRDPYHSTIWKHLKKDGSIIHVETIFHDINFDNRKACLILANDVTEKLKAEAEINSSYNQLKELTAHLQSIREEERARIARKIHDDLGQQLTSLKLDASWIGRKITTEDKFIQDKLSNMISLIDETMKTVRQISSELRPGILDDLGLIAALEWQSQEFEKRTGIKSQFHSEMDYLNLEKNLSINIFRVHQESLTNITRHARATRVESTLEEKDGYMKLIIKDNGQGFDPEEVKRKKSLGLIGMRERAFMFQGELTIESEKLKGTIVTLKVPILEPDKREP